MLRAITKRQIINALAGSIVGDEFGPADCDILNRFPGGRSHVVLQIAQRLSTLPEASLRARYNALFGPIEMTLS